MINRGREAGRALVIDGAIAPTALPGGDHRRIHMKVRESGFTASQA